MSQTLEQNIKSTLIKKGISILGATSLGLMTLFGPSNISYANQKKEICGPATAGATVNFSNGDKINANDQPALRKKLSPQIQSINEGYYSNKEPKVKVDGGPKTFQILKRTGAHDNYYTRGVIWKQQLEILTKKPQSLLLIPTKEGTIACLNGYVARGRDLEKNDEFANNKMCDPGETIYNYKKVGDRRDIPQEALYFDGKLKCPSNLTIPSKTKLKIPKQEMNWFSINAFVGSGFHVNNSGDLGMFIQIGAQMSVPIPLNNLRLNLRGNWETSGVGNYHPNFEETPIHTTYETDGLTREVMKSWQSQKTSTTFGHGRVGLEIQYHFGDFNNISLYLTSGVDFLLGIYTTSNSNNATVNLERFENNKWKQFGDIKDLGKSSENTKLRLIGAGPSFGAGIRADSGLISFGGDLRMNYIFSAGNDQYSMSKSGLYGGFNFYVGF